MLHRKKNLRTFDKFENVAFISDPLFDPARIQATFPDLSFCNKSVYYLNNVLTDAECESLIHQSQDKFSSLQDEFLTEERAGNRLLAIDKPFAAELFRRIESVVRTDLKLEAVKPCGFGTDGSWKPDSVNSCFRYNQYFPGMYFKPHRDATFIENEDRRSILTLLLYLNDDFSGGDTVFHDAAGPRTKEDLVQDELARGYRERFRFKPKKGSVLVFNHNMIHEGETVTSGVKYVVRSDIVFQRVSRPETYTENWKRDPDFLLAIDLFRRAINCELDGQLQEASIYYQRELAIRQNV